MNLRVTAVTVELDKLRTEKFRDTIGDVLNRVNCTVSDGCYKFTNDLGLNEFLRNMCSEFSGKNAGICYMADSYDSQKVSGESESLKRFTNTIISTHHSIADHCKVTVLFENVPKIFAMIMNSFRDYATSEKSARYTVMENLPEDESNLYNKWREILKNVLVMRNDVPEKQAEKLANENARYFISIFSPATTFSYTTSIRQWNYINQWFKELVEVNTPKDGKDMVLISGLFYERLKPWLLEFSKLFESTFVYNDLIQDPKGRRIDFIPQLYPDTSLPLYEKNYYRDAYCVHYHVSFSSLAQLHRHRSIQYIINDLRSMEEPAFFVPDFLSSDESLTTEWLDDIRSVKDNFPQGLVVEVVELGTIGNFLLKCDERLCGRAQYETMACVSNVLRGFYEEGNLSKYFEKWVASWIEVNEKDGSLRVKAKCEMRPSGCADKGGCLHGPLGAIDRTF